MLNLNIIDYKIGEKLSELPFAALISAAMRKADSNNLYLLEQCFPEILKDLKERYNAPGGQLDKDGDIDYNQLKNIVDSYITSVK